MHLRRKANEISLEWFNKFEMRLHMNTVLQFRNSTDYNKCREKWCHCRFQLKIKLNHAILFQIFARQ